MHSPKKIALSGFGDCSTCQHKDEMLCMGCMVLQSDGTYGRLNYLPENGTYSFSETIDFSTQKGEN